MALKLFEKWRWEELKDVFGYQRVFGDFEPLQNWLDGSLNETIDAQKMVSVEELRLQLNQFVDGYNEEELKVQFIGLLLSIINFNNFQKYRLFLERKFSAPVNLFNGTTEILGGRVEAVVASGIQDPKKPYLFVHEYKPLNKSTPADPLGQLVAAMIVAQQLNKDDKPVYGLYVTGKNWVFVTLKDKEFTESKWFDATVKEDLYRILQLLAWTKNYIDAQFL